VKEKKYIVTGGAGFIGSHLSEALLSQGHKVVVIDDLSTGFRKYLPKNDNLIFLKLDISKWDDISKNFGYFTDVEGVFHLAAMARVQPSIYNPVRHHEVNINGVFNVLEIMRMMDIKKIVYSASSTSYGLKKSMPCVEIDQPDCLNPYALSKYVGEQYCKTWGKIYGIHNACLKYFNVYGERSPLQSPWAPIIGLFFKQALHSKPMTIVGDGKQRRDFTNIKDIVKANILTMERIANNDVDGETFNIGTGRNYSIIEIVGMIEKELISRNKMSSSVFIPSRPGEANETLADVSKFYKAIGWKPEINLEDCISDLYLYYNNMFIFV
jgi:UDP-glucose 4-epimerase